jgi:hypothetical protein
MVHDMQAFSTEQTDVLVTLLGTLSTLRQSPLKSKDVRRGGLPLSRASSAINVEGSTLNGVCSQQGQMFPTLVSSAPFTLSAQELKCLMTPRRGRAIKRLASPVTPTPLNADLGLYCLGTLEMLHLWGG